MKNFVNGGGVIEHTPASAVTGGAPLAMGDTVGVAVGDIASGDPGAVAIEGVFEVAKTSGTGWTQGDRLDFDKSAGAFAKGLSAATGDVTGCAIAAADAPAGATVGLVKLANPGTVT